jgi:hypothetical protein
MAIKYEVVSVVAPLFADEKMSHKKGKVSQGVAFYLEKKNTEGTMLKTSSVIYKDQESGALVTGDGWLEAAKCALAGTVTPPPPPPATDIPSEADFQAFGRVMAWLKTLIG